MMLPRSAPAKVLTSPVLPPTEITSGTTAAICTRSWANDTVVYSLTAPRGRRYLGFGQQSCLYSRFHGGTSCLGCAHGQESMIVCRLLLR